MKYHLVINGFSSDFQGQVEELNGFSSLLAPEMEEGEAIILGHSAMDWSGEAKLPAKKVRRITMEAYAAEPTLEVLCGWMQEDDLYIWGNGTLENELAVRGACRLQGTSLSDVSGIRAEAGGLLAEKMVYANHMKAVFRMRKGPFCVTLEKGMEKAPVDEAPVQVVEEHFCKGASACILSEEFFPEERESGLENAKLVIVGGRGCGNRQAVEELGSIARKMGGQLGISRPAAMNAWASMDKMVGVSGAMICPDICITAGVSGAAAFYAGIEKSKMIIAINKDEKAPIMKKADVAVVDDLRPVLEELSDIVQQG